MRALRLLKSTSHTALILRHSPYFVSTRRIHVNTTSVQDQRAKKQQMVTRRPLSPYLMYKLPFGAYASFVNRVTGFGLVLGMSVQFVLHHNALSSSTMVSTQCSSLPIRLGWRFPFVYITFMLLTIPVIRIQKRSHDSTFCTKSQLSFVVIHTGWTTVGLLSLPGECVSPSIDTELQFPKLLNLLIIKLQGFP